MDAKHVPPPKFAVIGTGGVGGYLGGKLSNAGLDVTFVARKETADILSTKGLILKTVDEEIVLPAVKAVNNPRELRDVDVVLLTTKTYDLESAVSNLSEEIAASSMLVTFQNGVDNDRRIKEIRPDLNVFPGIAYIVSQKTEPGLIHQTAGPRKFLLGDRHASELHTPRLNDLALVMRDAGIDTEVSPNIEKALWTKFAWIVAFAGVTGICRTGIGNIVNDPAGFRMFTRAMDEAIEVAQSLGVDIGDEAREKILAKAEGYKTTALKAKASLAIDIENGNRTELEALHGTVVRLGQEKGISTPTNSLIYDAIRLGHEVPLEFE